MVYTFVANSVGLSSVNLTHFALKTAVSYEVTRNDGHWAVDGHSGQGH